MIKLKDLIVEKNYRLGMPEPNYKRAGKTIASRWKWYLKKFGGYKGVEDWITTGSSTGILSRLKTTMDVTHPGVSDLFTDDEIKRFPYKKLVSLAKKLPKFTIPEEPDYKQYLDNNGKDKFSAIRKQIIQLIQKVK